MHTRFRLPRRCGHTANFENRCSFHAVARPPCLPLNTPRPRGACTEIVQNRAGSSSNALKVFGWSQELPPLCLVWDPQLQSSFCFVLCWALQTPLSLGGVPALRVLREAHLCVIYLWKTSPLTNLWLLFQSAVPSFYRMILLSNNITFPLKTCSFSLFNSPGTLLVGLFFFHNTR